MNPQLIAMLLDHSLSIVGGIFGTLIGLRLLGPKPGSNDKFDSLHARWVKHLKWLGPLLIVISIVQLAISVNGTGPSVDSTEWKNKTLQTIQKNVSTEGQLAEYDLTIEAPEGFKVVIPKGFTYSKPPGTPFSLVAVSDPNGAATPAFTVSVMGIDDNFEQTIEGVKSILVAKNQTTKFTKTHAIEAGQYKFYRTSMSSQRAGGNVRGEMVFFESGGKMFMLNCGTREELFNANVPVFEKIVRSFGPH